MNVRFGPEGDIVPSTIVLRRSVNSVRPLFDRGVRSTNRSLACRSVAGDDRAAELVAQAETHCVQVVAEVIRARRTNSP